ncbi:MAG: HigA family addiction module antitoxin [Dissulfurispiraceae bacterium]
MFDLKREPTHPGEILQAEFITPLQISQTMLARELKTTFRTVNEIVNKKRNISPEMALKLGKFFGTTPELWLNLQNKHDLYWTKKKKQATLKNIRPMPQHSSTPTKAAR